MRRAKRGIMLVIIAILPALIHLSTGACRQRADAGTAPASPVEYYDDARGAFTLLPPPDHVGTRLRLRGTSSFPELMVRLRNTASRKPARQAVYRMGGKAKFDFTYIIRDGAGEYEAMIFGKHAESDLEIHGLCSFRVRSAGSAPEDEREADISGCVLSFVRSATGRTIGSGECWDLAQEALDSCGADWSRPLGFGLPLDPGKDAIRPGDIIQFREVRIVEKTPDGGTRWQVIGTPDHTAIITGVTGDLEYRLAHQNIGGNRSVVVTTVNLGRMTSGRFWIYRPVAGIIR